MGIGCDHGWVIRTRSLLAAAAVLFGLVVAHVLDGLAEVSKQHDRLPRLDRFRGPSPDAGGL